MKSILNVSKTILASAILTCFMAACNDAKYDVANNKIYITEAMSSSTTKLLVDPDNGADASFSISLSDKSASDVTGKLTASESALEAYNSLNGTNYKMLPAENYSFSEDQVVIPSGSVISSSINIHVNPFSEEQMESGDLYAIPVTVESASSDFSSLASLSSYIIILDQVIVTSVPVLSGSNPVTPTTSLRQDYNLSEWSLEFRLNMDGFSINNQAIASLNPSEIYVRFGDAGKDYNMLQIKTQGTQYESVTRFEPNKWYHIAIVGNSSSMKLYVNGVLDGTLNLSGSASWTVEKDKFSLISSGTTYFKNKCMLSEFRFWTKAISQSQIQNYMFAIDPETPGLEAYWKMNEGSGNVFNDATGHGNEMTAAGTISWQDGIRSDEQ